MCCYKTINPLSTSSNVDRFFTDFQIYKKVKQKNKLNLVISTISFKLLAVQSFFIFFCNIILLETKNIILL